MIVLEVNKLQTVMQLSWWQRWLLMSVGLVMMVVLFVVGLGMMLLLGGSIYPGQPVAFLLATTEVCTTSCGTHPEWRLPVV